MSAQPHVMVVEDDATVRTVVADYLRADGYRVSVYAEGTSAHAALSATLPDVLILDRMLPGIDGDRLCSAVRLRSDVPVLMLTARAAVDDRIDGLEAGADDYLTKPFAMRELQLRVRALLRRRLPDPQTASFSVGPFRVDPTRRHVWMRGREVSLTSREYELLAHLVRHPGEVLSRDDILSAVWGWSFGDASTVTVHVRRLREKIEPDARQPVFLRTVWGVGYRFLPEGDRRVDL